MSVDWERLKRELAFLPVANRSSIEKSVYRIWDMLAPLRGGGWTAGDYNLARFAAIQADDADALTILTEHHPHASHCGHWEVLAWPCLTAAEVLDRLLGGAA